MEYSYVGANNAVERIQSDKMNNDGLNSLVSSINENVNTYDINQENVLKYYNVISASDFDKFLIDMQQKKITDKSIKATEQAIIDKEHEKFYNLSIKNIAFNTTNVMIEIVNDLVIYLNSSDKSFGKLYVILSKKDRFIYLGIVLIILSVMLYFITVTS